MSDYGKVITGLRCIASDGVWCVQCPYSDKNGWGRGDRCKRECAKEAIVLLKAQQPRVMTLQEARRDIEIWYESINGACGYGDLCYDANAELAIYTPHGIKGVKEDDYGVTWRCWTSRPDEKVRTETPWQS